MPGIKRHIVENYMLNRPPEFRNINDVAMLKEVRALLRGRWIQYANAEDGDGNRVSPCSSEARRFCLRGACARVLHLTTSQLVGDMHTGTGYISTKIYKALGFDSSVELVEWNDHPERMWYEVETLLNERIATLKLEKKRVKPATTDH